MSVVNLRRYSLKNGFPKSSDFADVGLPLDPALSRYWRLNLVSVVSNHTPRVARFDFLIGATVYNLVTFAADNCSDSGKILGYDTSGTTVSYDFGSPVVPTQCQFYVSFSGTPYNSVVDFQGSSDNSTFTSFFQGNVNSSANPASPQCGLHEFSNLARL